MKSGNSPSRFDRIALPRFDRIALPAIILSAGGFSLLVVAQRFWSDDAFISFRYARNLLAGRGLVYNAGQHVEAYTNFLWVLVSGVGIALDLEPIHFTQAVSLLAQAGTLWLIYRMGITFGLKPIRALVAPLFLAGHVAFLSYPMTGMESSFFTLVTTLAFFLLHRGAYSSRMGSIVVALVLLVLTLIRFDGLVLVGVVLAYPLLFRRRMDELKLTLGVLVTGIIVYNGWRYGYYGALLPQSFHAKISFSVARSSLGFRQVRRFVGNGGELTVILASVPFLLRDTPERVKYLAWAVVCQFAYLVLVGGDWMPHHRFILHVLPLLYLLMQEGIWSMWDAIPGKRRRAAWSGALALAVLFGFNLAPLFRGLHFSNFEARHFSPHEARIVGESLGASLATDQLVAVEWAGIVPYYAEDHRFLDTLGITDVEIVQEDAPVAIFGRRIEPAYLARRGPDVVLPCIRLFPTADEALGSVQAQGACHYSWYPELRDHGYRYSALPLAPEGFVPVLVRGDRGGVGPSPGTAYSQES